MLEGKTKEIKIFVAWLRKCCLLNSKKDMKDIWKNHVQFELIVYNQVKVWLMQSGQAFLIPVLLSLQTTTSPSLKDERSDKSSCTM